MAGGKLSARQKMINLMYLVFIAMLAMNMSKEVLSAFGFMNEEIVVNNKSTTEKNILAYEGLDQKANDQPEKFRPLNTKAKELKSISSEFYNYLQDLKKQMTADIEDKTDYESMDKTEFLDEYFFEGDGRTVEGERFVNSINKYKDDIINLLGDKYKNLVPTVENRFNTTDHIDDETERTINWLDYRYKGFPLVASLTNLTQLQSNIKNTENDILNTLLGNQLINDSKLTTNNYKGIVRLEKTAYFAGETVRGEVVLGRYDSNLVPTKVTLGTKDITDNVENGQVILNMPAGNVGNKKFKGEITFMQDGKPEIIPFESEYSVIPQPGDAVVSADKMNVVYRGLNNPISVSLPGVSDNNLDVSAVGGRLSGGKGRFILRPGSGKTATIIVKAVLSSGKAVKSEATFRIKDLPAAVGLVRNQSGTVRMPKSGLANSPITAGYEDFDFDLDVRVTGFKIKIPGQLTIIVNGSRLTAAAKQKLSKAKRGDQINIYDIKATANGVPIKKVFPVNIELTN